MPPADGKPYWNTNVARHPGILRAVPPDCGDALDVGCGDGLLARKLAARAKRVTAIDVSPEMIAEARGSDDITFVEGDFLTADLPGEGYDFVCSVSTVHHMDFATAIARMRDLLRPGGTLVVVGLARDVHVGEWAVRIAVAPVVRIVKLLRRARDPAGMPVAEPRMSYREVRAAAQRLLPGVRYRRHVLRRYSLTWEHPQPPGTLGVGVDMQDLTLETVGPVGDCAVVQVKGEVDVMTAPQLRERMRDLAAKGAVHLMIDLRDVSFIDSSGLGVLVGGLKRVRHENGSVRLVITTRRILHIFEVTALTKVLPVTQDATTAVKEDPHWRETVQREAGDVEEWCRSNFTEGRA